MGRSTIFKSAQQEPKLVQGFFLTHAKGSKHFFLQFALEDPDRTSANLVAIQYHVVSIGLDLCIGMRKIIGCIMDQRIVVDHGLDL